MRCRKLKDILYNKEKKIEYSKDLYQRLNSYYKKYGIKQSNSNRKIKEMKKDYRQIELNID